MTKSISSQAYTGASITDTIELPSDSMTPPLLCVSEIFVPDDSNPAREMSPLLPPARMRARIKVAWLDCVNEHMSALSLACLRVFVPDWAHFRICLCVQTHTNTYQHGRRENTPDELG